MNSQHDSRLVMKYVYRGTTFSFIQWYVSLRRDRHDEKPSEEKVMDLKRCNLAKFLAEKTVSTPFWDLLLDLRTYLCTL